MSFVVQYKFKEKLDYRYNLKFHYFMIKFNLQ